LVGYPTTDSRNRALHHQARQGYSVFEHTSHGISQELLLFAPLESPVKISLLRLRNRTDRKRKLTTHAL